MLDRERMIQAGIDYDGAVKRFAGKEALYEKYFSRFPEDTHFQGGKDALAQGEYDKVLEEIHALKGVVGTLGMQELFQACQDVVTAIREEKIDRVPGLMEKIQEQYDKIIAFFQ